MDTVVTDRIEKQIFLKASRARVWKALTEAGEFGAWFRVRLDGPFRVGERATGNITYPGYEHLRMEVWVEAMETERRFAFRWHPNAVDPGWDYTGEATTLVEFRLEDQEGGTLLTLVESGFDRIPEARRAEAFRSNDGGWAEQLKNVARHVGH
jgi:uncharacterized protein YndB with AHSA1/START domain